MLRIVSVCRILPTPISPGAGVFVLRRLAAMAAAADVEILQPVPFMHCIRPRPAWAKMPRHDVDGIKIQHQPMFYVPGLMKSLDGYWLARSVLPRIRTFNSVRPVDLVDAHFGYPDGVGAVLAARRLGLPVFVTIRGLEAERVRSSLIRRQLITALNAATGCISVSHTLRDVLVAYGADPGNIAVIPNAVDRENFRPGSKESARAALAIEPDEKLVVSVGHLISGKRHDVLIEAVARFRDGGAAPLLAIVGGPDYEAACPGKLRKLAENLRISDRVRFIGCVPPAKIALWLQAADVFALATAREGCCNAILEALATGTPVVTTPVGDNAHYVSEGVNGHLVSVGDPAAMSVALATALATKWQPEDISTSLKVGTWNSVGRDVLAFFSQRLDGRQRVSERL